MVPNLFHDESWQQMQLKELKERAQTMEEDALRLATNVNVRLKPQAEEVATNLQRERDRIHTALTSFGMPPEQRRQEIDAIDESLDAAEKTLKDISVQWIRESTAAPVATVAPPATIPPQPSPAPAGGPPATADTATTAPVAAPLKYWWIKDRFWNIVSHKNTAGENAYNPLTWPAYLGHGIGIGVKKVFWDWPKSAWQWIRGTSVETPQQVIGTVGSPTRAPLKSSEASPDRKKLTDRLRKLRQMHGEKSLVWRSTVELIGGDDAVKNILGEAAQKQEDAHGASEKEGGQADKKKTPEGAKKGNEKEDAGTSKEKKEGGAKEGPEKEKNAA